MDPANFAGWTYNWASAPITSHRLAVGEVWIDLAVVLPKECLSRIQPPLSWTPLMVTDYTGHRRTVFPVEEINLKAYVDVILTQVTWPTLGIEPRAIHKQSFKPASRVAYCVKPQGQGHK